MLIRRRELLTGATALAAFAGLSGQADAYSPGSSLLSGVSQANQARNILNAQPPPVMVCCRQRNIPDGIFNDTVSNSLDSRASFWAPANADITDITLAFPGFAEIPGETDFNAATYRVALCFVEYPAGTYTQVFSSGQPYIDVISGRTLQRFDPCTEITIARGTKAWIRCLVTWNPGNFWIGEGVASGLLQDWTVLGTNITMTNPPNPTTQSTTHGDYGFAPIIYGRLSNPSVVVGIIGASEDKASADNPQVWDGATFWERAFQQAYPTINLSQGGDSLTQFLLRSEGRTLILRDKITHLIFGGMVSNQIYGTVNLATAIAKQQQAVQPFIDRGVKVYTTVSPRTTSTDGWLSYSGQTINNTSPGADAVQQAFNADLRANWKSYDYAGFIDFAAAIEQGGASAPTGLWNFDAGGTLITATAGGASAAAYATITGGAFQSATYGQYNAGSTQGAYGVASVTVPVSILNYQGDPGTGAVLTCNISSSGFAVSYNVVSPGSGYINTGTGNLTASTYHGPMISPTSKWTIDGAHPTTRGYNECIAHMPIAGSAGPAIGLGPLTFVL